MNYEELSKQVIEWGDQKGILKNSTPLRQLDKTQEELEETRDALEIFAKGCTDDTEDVKDGIGDMIVTIILLAELAGLDSVDCLQHAYDVIKGRTGKMVDGVFVKD